MSAGSPLIAKKYFVFLLITEVDIFFVKGRIIVSPEENGSHYNNKTSLPTSILDADVICTFIYLLDVFSGQTAQMDEKLLSYLIHSLLLRRFVLLKKNSFTYFS